MRLEKFKRGDLVRIAEDLGPMMEHFDGKGQRAIVIGSYRDQYEGSNAKDYTLFIENGGETSWYHEHQLTFIEHNPALLETWQERAEARLRDYTNIEWIVAHWEEIHAKFIPCTVLTLFALAEIETAFSHNGEYSVLLSDWVHCQPVFDSLIRIKTLEELRSHQSKPAPVEVVARVEMLWKKLHALVEADNGERQASVERLTTGGDK